MANDFTEEDFCFGHWRFESADLLADSQLTNDLTQIGSGATADTVSYKEGASSVYFDDLRSSYLRRTDADLSAGFPFKTGDTIKKFTVLFWFKLNSPLESMGSYTYSLVGKLQHSGNAQWYVYVLNDGAKWYLRLRIATDVTSLLTLGIM